MYTDTRTNTFTVIVITIIIGYIYWGYTFNMTDEYALGHQETADVQ